MRTDLYYRDWSIWQGGDQKHMLWYLCRAPTDWHPGPTLLSGALPSISTHALTTTPLQFQYLIVPWWWHMTPCNFINIVPGNGLLPDSTKPSPEICKLTFSEVCGIHPGVYTKFSGRLSEEPFPRLIQKFPWILIFKIGQQGCQLNLSEGQIRLDLTSGRPLV